MTVRDPLTERGLHPDRVAYATGVLLADDDFRAEQTYHRARLARSLAYLHGTGTVAGLGVEVEPRPETGQAGAQDGELVRVRPGLAIDPAGRLVEVPRSACIRLGRWLRGVPALRRETGFIPESWVQANAARAAQIGIPGGFSSGVESRGLFVVDVFLRFHPCPRGKTPMFASGAYEALDAVSPSRIRDAYELSLLLRQEDVPPLPDPAPWPDLPRGGTAEARMAALREEVVAAGWVEGTEGEDAQGARRLPEHAVTQDGTEVFLARLVVPASRQAGEAVQDVSRDAALAPLGQARRRIVLGAAGMLYLMGH